MRDIMNLAKDLINNIRESPKRMELFRSVISANATVLHDTSEIRPLCPTRWTMRASSVQQILKNYENILELFKTISSSDKNEAGYKCAGFLESMLTFKTYFLLQVYCYVMNPVEEVNRKVQSPDLSVTDLEDMFINLVCILEEKRGGFEDFWKFCLSVKPPSVAEPELARKRRIPQRYENKEAGAPHTFNTPAEFFKIKYIEICETVRSCVASRFDATGLSKVIAVERECLSVLNEGQKSDMTRSKEFFQNDLDTDRLFLHLSMLSDISKQKKLQLRTLNDVKKYFELEPSVKEMLPELVKGLKLLQVVPVTSATNERSFSALRRLKTYLRATMGQKRLNNLAITHAHQDILEEIDICQVINEFIKRNPVRRSSFALF
ncbi:zinc finger MYM-type protein 1-like [Nilaparvata lugens]|uniref:zinc finger MYM-type protein 1-like n=2 Tax=Nilaparvata lugens TaxID=108931 RepID=UPI00193D1E6D|nr:zinc finger MYM-type protein 1-like [Nilaparvata lugens]